MTLLDFARGPALEASLIIFVVGTIWRFLGALLLPWRLIAAEPRKGAPSPFVAALKGIVVKFWPYEPFQKAGVVQFVNGYIFHFGLAIVVFLFAPHILFIKSLSGLSWPALPNNLIMMIGVVTAASLARRPGLPTDQPGAAADLARRRLHQLAVDLPAGRHRTTGRRASRGSLRDAAEHCTS